MKIVLVEPEIPPNTGNIGRLCVGLRLPLYLVGKLGFSLDDRKLKRAGLDYWPELDLQVRPNLDGMRQELAQERPVLFTTKASQSIFETDLTDATALVFGRETGGLPIDWHELDVQKVCFPQSTGVRSYNLSNVVFGAAMEWARQTDYSAY